MVHLIVGDGEGFLKPHQAAYWAIPCANFARLAHHGSQRRSADPETVIFRLANKQNPTEMGYREGHFVCSLKEREIGHSWSSSSQPRKESVTMHDMALTIAASSWRPMTPRPREEGVIYWQAENTFKLESRWTDYVRWRFS
jgi:hypothetical protein